MNVKSSGGMFLVRTTDEGHKWKHQGCRVTVTIVKI